MVFLQLFLAFYPGKEGATSIAYMVFILMGIGTSLFAAAIWPMIPYTVDQQILGAAYGIGYGAQSLGIVFAPIIVGAIADANRRPNGTVDYFWVTIFLAGWAVLALVANMALMIFDALTDRRLISTRGGQRLVLSFHLRIERRRRRRSRTRESNLHSCYEVMTLLTLLATEEALWGFGVLGFWGFG
ncbi:MAG: hypothetical protein P4M11_13465, partial [Candidatus Pacebacteria bacterium]|nr:hypothetical protein [Candidatus Paceibacterota bacterium]